MHENLGNLQKKLLMDMSRDRESRKTSRNLEIRRLGNVAYGHHMPDAVI